VPEILHFQLAQLFAAQRVEQQRRENGAVALALDRILLRRFEQVACLVVADRRRLAFAAFGPRPLDAFDRVVGDGVLLTEIFEQRRQRGQPVPDRRAAEMDVANVSRAGPAEPIEMIYGCLGVRNARKLRTNNR
jgi:hypothetical protein